MGSAPPPTGPDAGGLPGLSGLPPLPGAATGLNPSTLGSSTAPPIYGMAAASPNGQAPVMHIQNSVVNVGQQRVATQGATVPGMATPTPPLGQVGGGFQTPLSGPLPTVSPPPLPTSGPPPLSKPLPDLIGTSTPPPPPPPSPAAMDLTVNGGSTAASPTPVLGRAKSPFGPTWSPRTGQYEV